jgi:hypothetical protein
LSGCCIRLAFFSLRRHRPVTDSHHDEIAGPNYF